MKAVSVFAACLLFAVGEADRRFGHPIGLVRRSEIELLTLQCFHDGCLLSVQGCGNATIPRHLLDCETLLQPTVTARANSTTTLTSYIFGPPATSSSMSSSSSMSASYPMNVSTTTTQIPTYATEACAQTTDYSSACNCIGVTATTVTSRPAQATFVDSEYVGCAEPHNCANQDTWNDGISDYTCSFGISNGTSACYSQFGVPYDATRHPLDPGVTVIPFACRSNADCMSLTGQPDWACTVGSCYGTQCVKAVANICDDPTLLVG